MNSQVENPLVKMMADAFETVFQNHVAQLNGRHDLLSVSQAAKRCHVTENTIREWARNNQIKYIGAGRSTRYVIPV